MMETDKPISIHTLSQADAQAVDAILEARAGVGQPPAADERTRQAEQLLKLIAQCPTEMPADDLTQRTLARIQEEEQRRELSLRIAALSAPAAAFRWRELVAVAAVLLMGLSVMWPMLAASREEARRLACQANLGLTGTAMARYAADNQGILPRGAVSPQQSWASVGGLASASKSPQNAASNPAQLYLLARGRYIAPDVLSCPDNPNAPLQMSPDLFDWPNAQAVSYSYQNQFTQQPLRLDRSANLALLADKNPLFIATPQDPCKIVFRGDLKPSSPTIFHDQRGQNILLATGSTVWSKQPELPNGDNIWTARGVKNYIGTESPTDANDTFLIP